MNSGSGPGATAGRGAARGPVLACIVAVAVHLGAATWRLDAVPRSFGDEPWYASPTITLVSEGTLRIPELPGRGGVARAYLQPKATPNLIAAPAVLLGGPSLSTFRAVSVLAGAVLLAATFAVGRELFGAAAGALATWVLLLQFWFGMTSRTFRPEIFEAAGIMLSGWLLVRALRTGGALVAAAAGAAIGATLLTHQLGAMLVVVLAVILASAEEARRVRTILIAAASAGLVLLPWVLWVLQRTADPEVSLLAQLTGEATPAERRTPLFLKEARRWGQIFLFPYGLPAAALAVAAVVRAIRAGGWDRVVALMFLSFAAVLLAAVPLSTGRYGMAALPLLSLLIARLALDLAGARRPRGVVLAAAALLLFIGPSVVALAATARAHRGASYAQFMAKVRDVVDGGRVAGPMAFRLGLLEMPYTVTNVAPGFELDPGGEGWLEARLEADSPRWILEATNSLFATAGLAPRPTEFPDSVVARWASRRGRVVATLPSRDFGPVRIWRIEAR